MEYKWGKSLGEQRAQNVLFVPIWNINSLDCAELSSFKHVLFVPIWNINRSQTCICHPERKVLFVPIWNINGHGGDADDLR